MSKLHDVASLLLEKAAEDQYILQTLAGDPKAADAAIGFHAQQAVEKLIKAVLANRGIEFPHTHDIQYLLHMIEQHHLPTPPDTDEVLSLTAYAVEYRYGRLPSQPQEPLNRNWGVAIVEAFRAWAEELVGP